MGTPEQISRLCRCTTTELMLAIYELDSTKAADIIECNGIVTVINRRMKRGYEERQLTYNRVLKYRKKISNVDVTPNETPLKRKRNAIVTPTRARSISSSSSSSIIQINKDFYLFWFEYPRKIGKGAAYKSWQKLKGMNVKPITIIEAVQQQKEAGMFQLDEPQFIPHPSTWLNQKRWEDEIPATPESSTPILH